MEILNKIKYFSSLVKISHTIFALPFAMIGYILGCSNLNELSLNKLFIIILCMFFARNAAMSFNRYIDRTFDTKNNRTKLRELPQKKLTPRSTLIFSIINSLLFIISTWFLNNLCFYLSFVALFIVFFYSYTKRFTIFSHIFIGISLALAPIGAYLAVIPQFNILPIILSAIVLLWVAGFDIIYALQDEQFDRQNNLFSIPAALGYQKSIIISEILHIISAILIIILGVYATFGALYWIGTILFITLLFYQHYIVRRFGMSKINLAFFTLNGIASIIFGMTTFIDIGFKYCLF